MVTFIIDNGMDYSSHAIYFVEAPKNFGKWFEKTLVPWLRERNMRGDSMRILATSPERLSWRSGGSSMKWEDFLNGGDYRFEEFDYTESPALPRPRYRGV